MELVYMNGTLRIILTIIVILMLFYMVIRFRPEQDSSNTSLETLKDRLERGEISTEAFERALQQQTKIGTQHKDSSK